MPDGRDAPAETPIRTVAASLCVAVTLIGCEETPIDPGRASEQAPVEVVRTVDFPGQPEASGTPPLDPPLQPYVDDRVSVFAALDGSVLAYAPDSDELLWRGGPFSAFTDIDQAFSLLFPWSRPAAASSTVVIPLADQRILALDLDTGEERWRWEPPAEGPPAPDVLAASDQLVFAGTVGGHLRAMDEATGDLVWSTDLGARPFGPILQDGVLYVGTRAFTDPDAGTGAVGRVGAIALEAATGDDLWRFEAPDPPAGGVSASDLAAVESMAPGALTGGVLVLSGRNGSFYGVDIADGSLAWTSDPPGEARLESGMAAVDGGIVLTGELAPVAVLDAASGDVLATDLTELGSSYPAAEGADFAYVNVGALVRVDASSAIASTFEPTVAYRTAPFFHDGAVYLGTTTGFQVLRPR